MKIVIQISQDEIENLTDDCKVSSMSDLDLVIREAAAAMSMDDATIEIVK